MPPMRFFTAVVALAVVGGDAAASCDVDSLWETAIGNACFGTEQGELRSVERALRAAAESSAASDGQGGRGWGRPLARGVLAAPPRGGSPAVRWAQAAVRAHLRATFPSGGEVTVEITDSWLQIGRPETWDGPAPHAHGSSDLVGHVFLSCPEQTCRLQLVDPRPRADAIGFPFKSSFLSWATRVDLLPGCTAIHPSWLQHYHSPTAAPGHRRASAASGEAALGTPRLSLTFTARVLAHTPARADTPLAVRFAELDEGDILPPRDPQTWWLWATPVAVLAPRPAELREWLPPLQRGLLAMATRLPSRSLSNFGGWQSSADLFVSGRDLLADPFDEALRELHLSASDRSLLASEEVTTVGVLRSLTDDDLQSVGIAPFHERRRSAAGDGRTAPADGLEMAKALVQDALRGWLTEAGGLQGGEAELEVFASWANVNGRADWNSPHGHDGDLSGVLYLSCPGKRRECEIELLDPRVTAAGVSPMDAAERKVVAEAQAVGPVRRRLREGSVLIFPAWVEHSVPPMVSAETAGDESVSKRISISFNCRVVSAKPGPPPLRVRFKTPPLPSSTRDEL